MTSMCTKAASRTTNISIIAANSPGLENRQDYVEARRRWKLCADFGIITARKESEVTDETSSAVDLAHVGILPDALSDWATRLIVEVTNAAKGTGAPAKTAQNIAKSLESKWERIVALVFMKAHCLQKVIRQVLTDRVNVYRKLDEEKKKKETEEAEEEEPADADGKDKKSSKKPKSSVFKQDGYEHRCSGLVCQHNKDNGDMASVKWVRTDSSTCQKCTDFSTILRMVKAAEQGILEDRDGQLNEDIAKIRHLPESKRLDEVILLAEKAVGNQEIWKKPKKSRSKNQYPQKYRDAARRLCNTFLIEPSNSHSGLDQALTRNQVMVLELLSKRMCDGDCESAKNANDDELHILCQDCTHLRENCIDEDCCKSCGVAVKEGCQNPCCRCINEWLIQNNSIQSRLDKIKQKMQQEKLVANNKRQKTDAPSGKENQNQSQSQMNQKPDPSLNRSMTAYRSAFTAPVGHQLPSDKQWKRNCRKVGLPLAVHPDMVTARLKRGKPDQDGREKQKLKISSTESDGKGLSRPKATSQQSSTREINCRRSQISSAEIAPTQPEEVDSH